ncbi:hypothetical protein COO60DRAFT_613137 [Scenedesmus sp. NREL 46B-D3]|nr:hypothetical protein COO60DRAFT_613137 [Scenedesmus sp. NREL 46B-D3]
MLHLRCTGQLQPRAGVKQAQPTLLPGRTVVLGSAANQTCTKGVVCAAAGSSSNRQSRQIVQFRQQGAGEVEEQELEYLRLDFDCTELLDLHGRESYLLCDVTKAHASLWALPLTKGYSDDVIEGRRELLDSIKERALLQEGRVKQDSKGIDLPVQLLPSALALLAQINQNDAVYDLASKLLDNWDMRKTYKRDIILSLAVARCNIARDLLADQKVADGCSVLEDALALLQSAGEPPLAAGLAGDIQEAVDNFVVQRILDQLRGPMTQEAAPARRRAVSMLRELLTKGSSDAAAASSMPRMVLRNGLFAFKGAAGTASALANGSEAAQGGAAGASTNGVTADYIRLVVDCLTSQELVGMANWEEVAKNASSTTWLYPGLLQIAATAHIAAGFTDRHPPTVRTANQLLRAVPGSCEVLLLRAVAEMLLGETEAALACVKEARSAPPDAFISWPVDSRAASRTPARGKDGDEPGLVSTTRLPPGPDAYAFLAAHSGPDEPGMLSGLCLYTEVFLSKVVFAGFPDTSQLQGASATLGAYFDSPQVQQILEQDKEAQAGLVGRMGALKDAVMSVQPLVRQFAESAKSAGIKLSSVAAGSSNSNCASRLAGDMGAGKLRAGSPDEDEADAAAAREQQQQQGGGSGLAQQVKESAAAGAAAVQAAAANLAAGFEQASGELQGRLGSKWPAVAAAAALAVAAAGFALTRGRGSDGALTPAPGLAAASVRSTADSSSSPTTPVIKQLDKAQALKLVKRFQAAKAAALGSEFDASQLTSVCVGGALQQYAGMSEDWASKGWFRTTKVWKTEVMKLEPRSSSGQRMAVTARIGEKSSTWGIDGQQGNSWSNEYDVEYDVVLCSDLQWRVQGMHVRGKDPAAGGLFGVFGGGGN